MAPALAKLSAEDIRKYQRQYLLVAILFLAGISCFVYLAIKAWRFSPPAAKGNLACVTHELYVSPDQHMNGLVHPGELGRVYVNYFSCNAVKRGELVYLKVASHIQPVIRIVRGIPGDHYQVYKIPAKSNRWGVKINGQAVETANGPLQIISKFDPALRTYQISRHGILRPNEYLLFSNASPSLEDSSDLGLIAKDRLLGRVF